MIPTIRLRVMVCGRSATRCEADGRDFMLAIGPLMVINCLPDVLVAVLSNVERPESERELCVMNEFVVRNVVSSSLKVS